MKENTEKVGAMVKQCMNNAGRTIVVCTRRLQLLCRLKINDPDAGDKALVAWKIKSSASDPRERRVCLIDFLIEVC